MSTKNLARTVIEGGRHNFTKREYDFRNQQLRVNTKIELRRYDDHALFPAKHKLGRDFQDRLGAAERWLLSQKNRPFNKVRAQMMEQFNPRSLAGQHIVFDHLLPRFGNWDWRVARNFLFWVDAHGILRAQQCKRKQAPQISDAERKILNNFLRGRKVMRFCGDWFWAIEGVRGRAFSKSEHLFWNGFSEVAQRHARADLESRNERRFRLRRPDNPLCPGSTG